MREKELNLAFVRESRTSADFVSWLLSRTKFAGAQAKMILARGDNPWYQSKRTGVQSETDILLVFECLAHFGRFALHIETKRFGDKFRPNQPELYHERAMDWMGLSKWGGYKDFEVMLVAPRAFYQSHQKRADLFHRYIPFEDVAEWVPEFRAALG